MRARGGVALAFPLLGAGLVRRAQLLRTAQRAPQLGLRLVAEAVEHALLQHYEELSVYVHQPLCAQPSPSNTQGFDTHGTLYGLILIMRDWHF